MLDESTFIKIPKFKVESPNVKRHWTKAYSLTKADRDKGILTKKAKGIILLSYLNKQPLPSLPIRITMVRVAPNLFDDDNLVGAFKPIRDFIADYFIPGKRPGRADSDPRIKWCYDQRRGKTREYAIELHIDGIEKKEVV